MFDKIKSLPTKAVALGVALAVCVPMAVGGCSTHYEKSVSYSGDPSGKEIKVSVDAKKGYDLTFDSSGNFDVLDGDGETVVSGAFVDGEQFDVYRDAVNAGTFDGTDVEATDEFVTWSYEEERNKIVAATDDTSVLMGSVASAEDAEAAYEAITVSVED